MKKIIVIILIVFSAQVSFSQNANKADVMKLITLSGSNNAMDSAFVKIFELIPADKKAAFKKEFDATLPSLYDKLALVYMETYTQQEIKDLLKFYETPLGKKMASSVGVIMEKSMEIGQNWGAEELQPLMEKYLKE